MLNCEPACFAANRRYNDLFASSVNTVSLTQFRDNPWASSCRRVKFGEDRNGQEIAANCHHA